MKNKMLIAIFAAGTLLFFFSCGNQWITEIVLPRTISFESNGGNPVESQTVYKGFRIKRPSNPSKISHAFGGWYADNDTFETLWDFDDIPGADMTLYAKWIFVPNPVTGVMLTKHQTSIYLYENDPTETLTAIISPHDATYHEVIWSSSDTHTAAVSEDGFVSAHFIGTAVITVTSVDGGFTDNCIVHVTGTPVDVTGVSLDRTAMSIKAGDYDYLIAEVTPAEATNQKLIWISSNPAAAKVVNGEVTGVSAGTAIIMVATVDGPFKAECTVTITP